MDMYPSRFDISLNLKESKLIANQDREYGSYQSRAFEIMYLLVNL